MTSPDYRIGPGLLRGLVRRCPLCGSRDVFRSWLQTREACPGCGIRMDRGEDDFFLGGFTVNFIAVELFLVAFLVAMVVITWPAVPWNLLVWIGAPLLVIAPVVFYPFSRTIWLALDLGMRPPRPEDFAGDQPGDEGRAAHGPPTPDGRPTAGRRVS